ESAHTDGALVFHRVELDPGRARIDDGVQPSPDVTDADHDDRKLDPAAYRRPFVEPQRHREHEQPAGDEAEPERPDHDGRLAGGETGTDFDDAHGATPRELSPDDDRLGCRLRPTRPSFRAAA